MSPDARALFRWSGRASVDGAEREWSLILKVWRLDAKSDAPERWNYWKREFLAYSSGILRDLPGISAPLFLGAIDEGEVASVWLEDVAEDEGRRWPKERYVRAAAHLGRFNGAYVAELPIPNAPFLSRGHLRSWIGRLPWLEFAKAPESWRDPMVAAAFPRPPIARLERLHADAEALFDRLDRLPQTFSHLDAWRSNLLSARTPDGRERTVAIDWSSLGTAPVGQEIAIFVGGSHIWLDAEPRELAAMSAEVFAAYVDGLRDAGWRGDEHFVRFAYAASSALYLAPLLPFWIARIADPARREWVERKCGRGADEVVRGWALLLDHALALADEASALARRLDEGH